MRTLDAVGPVKLLLDECLSPAAAQRLCAEHGVDAIHVRDRGLQASLDHEIFAFAFEQDRILATANVRDFVKLAKTRELHAGLILVERENMLRDEQFECLVTVVRALEGRDMANKAVWVREGNVLEFVDLPE